jgi:RNA 2',3'-cyclic 3'-phosphodiesterase
VAGSITEGSLPTTLRVTLLTAAAAAGHTSLVRLFVAVDIPEPVASLVAGLSRPPMASVRWTTYEQWHVTLRFLGEMTPSSLEGSGGLVAALDAVPLALAEAGGGPLRATLGPALAWFPGRRVLQVPVVGLEQLAAAVARATVRWGAAEQPYRGHLTLARVRGQARGPALLAGAPVAATWEVGEFVLYSSALGRGGPRYRAVHRVALPG